MIPLLLGRRMTDNRQLRASAAPSHTPDSLQHAPYNVNFAQGLEDTEPQRKVAVTSSTYVSNCRVSTPVLFSWHSGTSASGHLRRQTLCKAPDLGHQTPNKILLSSVLPADHPNTLPTSLQVIVGIIHVP